MFTLLLGFVVIDHRWWHQCLSRRRLKVSTFLAVTTEFGRLFHTSTTRFVKKFFLVSVLHRFFTSFSECPLVKLTGLFLSTGCRPLCSVSSLHQFQFLLRLWGWIRNCIANSDPSSNCLACKLCCWNLDWKRWRLLFHLISCSKFCRSQSCPLVVFGILTLAVPEMRVSLWVARKKILGPVKY